MSVWAAVAAAGAFLGLLKIRSRSNGTSISSQAADALLASADSEQVKMMEELVILVDSNDNVLGSQSKKLSHLVENINKGMLHRAFSVFLFTPDGKLIVQQRAVTKVTFPGYFANTCCSHPLHTPSELDPVGAIGVKCAAIRKLGHELGIPAEDVPIESFTYITRIHYKAAFDGVWGEHEIDYVLFCKPKVTPRMQINPNEIASVLSLNRQELRAWVAAADSNGLKLCPWFRVIHDTFLHMWWQAMDQGRLDSVYDPVTIYRAPGVEGSPGVRKSSSPSPLSPGGGR